MRVLPGIPAADVDYESVVAYHRHGTAIRRAPYLIAFACVLLLVKTGADLATVRGAGFRPTVLLVSAAVTAALALWWLRGRMPGRYGSVAFVAVADIAPVEADHWLIANGARFGLCQVFANEIWHFELVADDGQCPPLKPNAATS